MCISLECLIISSRQSKPLRKILGGFKFKNYYKMNDKELILWVICSLMQVIFCIILLWIEEDKQTYKEIFLWLILGITPISVLIVTGISLVLLITGIYSLLEYIGEKLFNLTKNK